MGYDIPELTDKDRTRFWSKVNKDGPTPEHRPELGPCWTWTGTINQRSGYGQIGIQGRTVYAHRVAWKEVHGHDPEDRRVLHHCDNPPCVNAETHHFLGTQGDNMRDMFAKNRRVKTATGARNGKSKLTEEAVVAMRSRYQGGEKISVLAKEFGVSFWCAEDAIKGKNWKV